MGGIPVLLIVEDEPALVRTYKRLFTSDHYELVVVRSAAEARLEIQRLQGRLRLLLVDYNLPDGKGTLLADEVRASLPSVHIILLTGEVLPQSRYEVVEKPFSFRELQARLLELLSLPP